MPVLQCLLDGVRTACAAFPDKRRGGDVIYSMADIGLSAFALFFMQSESFLAYLRGLEEGRRTSNGRTLFGMAAIPTDNHIRSMLDPVDSAHLQPAFDDVSRILRQRGGLAPFQRLGGRVPIGLDGTEYFCSQKLGCAQCLTGKEADADCRSVVASTLSPCLFSWYLSASSPGPVQPPRRSVERKADDADDEHHAHQL